MFANPLRRRPSRSRIILTGCELLTARENEEHVFLAQERDRHEVSEAGSIEEALRDTGEVFRSVLQHSSDILTILEADATIRYESPSIGRVLGYKPDELIGKSAFNYVHPEDLEQVRAAFAEVVADRGATCRVEYRFRHADGSWRRLEGVGNNLLDDPNVRGLIVTSRDITEAEGRLREAEIRFQTLVEQIPAAIYVEELDEEGKSLRYMSPQYEAMLGYSPEEGVSHPEHWLEIIHPEDRERVLAEDRRTDETLEPFRTEYRIFASDGRVLWMRDEAVAVRDEEGNPLYWIGVLLDITEQRLAQEALEESEEIHRRQAQELALLYRVSSAVAQELDMSVVFRTVVEAVAQTFGYTLVSAYLLEDEALVLQHQVGYGRVIERIPITEGVSGRVVRTGEPVLLEDVREDPAFIGAVEGITSEVCVPLFDRGEVVGILNVESMGGVVLTEADLRLVSALAEQVGGAIGRARLYTRVRESEERLTYRAFHDPLTGLANRSLFLNRLEHARARAKRRKGRLAVLFMDLDNFKVINDSLGHDIGDRLLVTVAERLRTCVRPQDTVARFGGDEFVALLEDLADAGAAARVADRIMDELREPFEIDGHRLHTSASIGIALDAASGGDLLRAADTAMYRAKENGKGRYEVFREAMHDRAVERLRLENDLRAVLNRDELAVHYQPKVSLRTGKVVGLEALLRWRHPEYGLLSPGDFMPLAEQTGLIVPIGRWVLLETCRQARTWREIHPNNPPLMACVNLSVRQLRQTDFVTEILDETGLDPGSLVLEITEDAVMEDAQSAIGALKRLEGLGIKLAIDDFGTGYSSLSYLRTLPVDYLKIDRSFVERLGEDPRDAEIVSGTITLAHTLGLEAVAEGVENADQLEQLREMGCDLAQGNHFSRPLAAPEAKRYLERDQASTP
jgi:diguanylate cyclase (GGDEF)-like protein/PAS domain S-box-containing protein